MACACYLNDDGDIVAGMGDKLVVMRAASCDMGAVGGWANALSLETMDDEVSLSHHPSNFNFQICVWDGLHQLDGGCACGRAEKFLTRAIGFVPKQEETEKGVAEGDGSQAITTATERFHDVSVTDGELPIEVVEPTRPWSPRHPRAVGEPSGAGLAHDASPPS